MIRPTSSGFVENEGGGEAKEQKVLLFLLPLPTPSPASLNMRTKFVIGRPPIKNASIAVYVWDFS